MASKSYVSNVVTGAQDRSANGSGAQSVSIGGTGNKLDQRSGYTEFGNLKETTFGGSGLTIGSGGSLTIATDQGSLDVAREISLSALAGADRQAADLRHFVESNQNLARSIAEGAFAVAGDAPAPDTTRRALWIGGGLVALALLLKSLGGLGRSKKKDKTS